MYKPAAKRRWGYYALPILHDDRLVGKVDAAADRKVSALRVNAIHEDVKFSRAMTRAVQAELEDLASWLGLGAIESGRTNRTCAVYRCRKRSQMSLRRSALAGLILYLALGAGCDSGGAKAGAPTATAPATPNPARRLAPLPARCPGPRPQRLVGFADYGNLIGSSPVWAGFYASFDSRRGGYHVHRDAPRTRYGWRIKVLWVVAADAGGPARATATTINGRSRLWFKVGERDRRPVAQAVLDPAMPGVPPTGDYLEFPTYVFIPRAGCYSFDASWPGGRWRLVVGVGR